MSTSYTRQRIRIAFDVTKQTANIDKITGETPRIWRGNDIVFEIAAFYGNPLSDASTLIDVSNIASLTLEVKPFATRTGGSVMTKTITSADINTALTTAQWNADSAQHASIVFTNLETAPDLGSGTTEANYWLVVSVITNDSPGREITWGYTTLTIEEDGNGSATSPTPSPPVSYTKAEADARFQQIDAGGLVVANLTTGKHHLVNLVTVNGVVTINITQTSID
jgi:hypothetical protein